MRGDHYRPGSGGSQALVALFLAIQLGTYGLGVSASCPADTGCDSGSDSGSGSAAGSAAAPCAPGFAGPSCLPCERNAYAANCSASCQANTTCNNNGRCSGKDGGGCTCFQGWVSHDSCKKSVSLMLQYRLARFPRILV